MNLFPNIGRAPSKLCNYITFQIYNLEWLTFHMAIFPGFVHSLMNLLNNVTFLTILL